MLTYEMIFSDEAAKKVFDGETYKIIKENERLKCENAELKREQAILCIRNEITKTWAFHYYMKDSQYTNATEYVINLDDSGTLNTYIKLARHYGFELVDETIETMLKEAQGETE